MLCPWVMQGAKETFPDSYCLATRQQTKVLQVPCDQKETDASFVRLSRLWLLGTHAPSSTTAYRVKEPTTRDQRVYCQLKMKGCQDLRLRWGRSVGLEWKE